MCGIAAVEELPYDPDWSSTGYTVKKYGGNGMSLPVLFQETIKVILITNEFIVLPK